nr:two-component response regulator ARR22 [Ipomoea batatas]GME19765.1 two-component response regulator ARR22 [Ipomoea batatas]GME19998.1 two-component response regulator ARR22 [Ipomoea batatas]
MLLKKYELEAQLAKNGKEAVVLHRFDLLLMDKEMPVKDGVNFLSVCTSMGNIAAATKPMWWASQPPLSLITRKAYNN